MQNSAQRNVGTLNMDFRNARLNGKLLAVVITRTFGVLVKLWAGVFCHSFALSLTSFISFLWQKHGRQLSNFSEFVRQFCKISAHHMHKISKSARIDCIPHVVQASYCMWNCHNK